MKGKFAAVALVLVSANAKAASCPMPGAPPQVVFTACGVTLDLLGCSDPMQPYEPNHAVSFCGEGAPDDSLVNFKGGAYGTDGHGIQKLWIPECGIAINVPNPSQLTPELSIDSAPAILDGLWALCQAGKARGFGMPKSATLHPAKPPTGGPYVVDEGDVEVEFGGLSVTSLEVHGMLIVLGGSLEVSGKAVIDGLVLADGAGGIRADELEIKSRSVLGQRLGGLVAGGAVQARKVTIDKGVLLARPILPIGNGKIEVTESFWASDASVDADLALLSRTAAGAGAPISLLDKTSLQVRRLVGEPIVATKSSISRVEEMSAPHTTLTDTQIDAAALLKLDASAEARVTGSDIRTAHLVGTLGSADFDAATTIDVSERGGDGAVFAWGESLVAVFGSLELHAGGSYGSYGGTHGSLGDNNFAPATPPQGHPHDPDLVGMGKGGWGIATATEPKQFDEDPRGGKGGGWIQISASDLRWNGKAKANGGHAATGNIRGGGGGGTGGSITVLVKGALTGSGTFHANGGNGSQSQSPDVTFLAGGGGSGGRIALKAGSLGGWMGRGEVVGGLGGVFTEKTVIVDYWFPPWWDYRNHGGTGTVYTAEGTRGTIEIDGAGLGTSSCPNGSAPRCRGVGALTGDFPDDDIVLKNATVVTDGLRARSLRLVNARVLGDNARVRMPWPSPDAYETPYGTGMLTTYQWVAPLAVWGESNEERIKVEVSADLDVDAASTIDLTGQGGYSRSELLDPGYFNWAGGSHGGRGGQGRLAGLSGLGSPSPTYGNPDQPTDVGLAGFASHGYEASPHAIWDLAGEGGGALRLIVGGTARLDGSLRADGAPGRKGDATAGGAGGSVWLTCGKLQGNGEISASGGNGKRLEQGAVETWIIGGGGGGGRVAVACDVASWTGKLRADGGDNPGVTGIDAAIPKGEPGTVRVAGTKESPGPGTPPAGASGGGAETDGGGCSAAPAPGSWGGSAFLLVCLFAAKKTRQRATRSSHRTGKRCE